MPEKGPASDNIDKDIFNCSLLKKGISTAGSVPRLANNRMKKKMSMIIYVFVEPDSSNHLQLLNAYSPETRCARHVILMTSVMVD